MQLHFGKLLGNFKMTKDEALRMAIGDLVLQKMISGNDVPVSRCTITATEIQACKEALAETQEPVAWMNDIAFSMDKELLGTRSRIVPLYTTPPIREWQRLSDEEIEEAVNYLNVKIDYPIMFARLIEMHLKEKNG